jgi:hypothetical protein
VKAQGREQGEQGGEVGGPAPEGERVNWTQQRTRPGGQHAKGIDDRQPAQTPWSGTGGEAASERRSLDTPNASRTLSHHYHTTTSPLLQPPRLLSCALHSTRPCSSPLPLPLPLPSPSPSRTHPSAPPVPLCHGPWASLQACAY